MDKIEIRTERLLLRPWRLTDVDAAFEYGQDPEWGRYLWDIPQPYTRPIAEAFVQMASRFPWTNEARFAIVYQHRAIGGLHLYVTDAISRVAGLGYNVARTHWGHGIASEAGRAVLRYAFLQCELHKVYSRADSRNAASLGVMRKLGMTQEAVLRKHRSYRGDYIDEIWCSILRDEWHDNQ